MGHSRLAGCDGLYDFELADHEYEAENTFRAPSGVRQDAPVKFQFAAADVRTYLSERKGSAS